MNSANAALLEVGRQLARQAGRGDVEGLTRLSGGRNNQVYRVEITGGEPLALKRYFRDARDRLGAEWSFVSHAWSRGVRTVPEPLVCDPGEQVALYSFVRGRKLLPSELSSRHVNAAINFVLAINERPRAVLAPGAEACFSLAEHIATVERRIARLGMLDTAIPHAADAQRLVSAKLLPAWTAVKARLEVAAAAAGLSIDAMVSPDACCLSPSDFGFHNALLDEAGVLTFLDFEYAGRDDPAKLISDFFCQPEVPVPQAFHVPFIDRLAKGLGLDSGAVARCRLLLDAYQIKWTCIILNDFLPLEAARRDFAGVGARAKRCAEQLGKAEAKLAALGALRA